MRTSLQGIAVTVDTRLPLTDVNPVELPGNDCVDMLLAGGFRSVIVAPGSNVLDMAASAAAAAIQNCGFPAAEIDGILLSTESFADLSERPGEPTSSADVGTDRFRRAMASAGFVNAQSYANWLSGCANFSSSLVLARALISSNVHRRVLLIFADRVLPGTSRLVESTASIRSDAAVACVMSTEDAGFFIRNVVVRAWCPVQNKTDYFAQYRRFVEELEGFQKQVVAETGRRFSDYQTLILDNFHPTFLQILCDCLKLNPQKIITPTRLAYGHVPAGDPLISILELQRANRLPSGSDVGLMNVAKSVIGFTVLRAP